MSICKKSPEISDVVKNMDLDAVIIIETWQTNNASNQKIVSDVTPVGYPFHYTARINKRVERVGILLRDSLSVKPICAFMLSL